MPARATRKRCAGCRAGKCLRRGAAMLTSGVPRFARRKIRAVALVPAVAAHWKPVDLKLRDSFTTDSGECELVEQIRHKIVPLFATRNVDLRANCIPHQASVGRPTLKLELLAPDAAQHPAEAPQAAR